MAKLSERRCPHIEGFCDGLAGALTIEDVLAAPFVCPEFSSSRGDALYFCRIRLLVLGTKSSASSIPARMNAVLVRIKHTKRVNGVLSRCVERCGTVRDRRLSIKEPLH